MHTCTKLYENLPAAHRQHTHSGHCAQIHGHNWSFEITFAADDLDLNGFVIDFGALRGVERMLENTFDHTLLLNASDPELPHLQKVLRFPLAKIVVVENCGAEALAEMVCNMVRRFLHTHFDVDVDSRGLRVTRVTCYEDSKNSATYIA